MDFVSHREITPILLGRSAIQLICLFWRLSVCTLSFDGLKSPLFKKCLSDLFIRSSKVTGFSCTIKLKCFLMKPTHDAIIETREVYIQLSSGRYKGKLVLRS